MNKQEVWTPFQWHCSNCGNIVRGIKNQNGMIKVKCNRCQVVMVRKPRTKCHDTIDIYAPEHNPGCRL